MVFHNPWRSLKTRVTVITSAIWLVSLWALAFTVSAWQLQDLRALLGANQFSTASIIATQVGHQLDERIRSLEAVAALVPDRFLSNPRELQAFIEEKPVLSVLFNGGSYITGRDGVALASVPASMGRTGLNYSQRAYLHRTLDEGVPTIGEVVVGVALGVPVFTISAPIRTPSGEVIGAIVGVTDLTKPNFLDQIQQNGLGRSGGFLLVAGNQRLIVTATEKTRIMEHLAGPGVNPAIDRLLQGWEGFDVLSNPQGDKMLVGVKQIPMAGWYVAAATPTAEAFGPAANLQNLMLLITAALTLLTGFANWFVLKRQLSPVMATIKTLSSVTGSSHAIPPLAVARKDEIGDLIESFNRLLRERERREEEKGRFDALISQNQRLEALGMLAGGIAHDFNNLLAGIFGNVELARLKGKNGPGEPYLTKTLATLDRARNLTQQLMTFSKGGKPELHGGDLFPFVEEAVRFALSGSPVSCRFDVEPGLWPCRFDRSQLGQVVDNLVINALQAMPSGGLFLVTARNIGGPDRWVRLSFLDTGPGISPEVQARLFEPFFTTKTKGYGLGLTTCYSIIHKHGGTIEVESEVGHGATFHVSLPAASLESESASETPEPPLVGRGTVLVMDDAADVGLALEELLGSFGFSVIRTESGEQAVAAFEDDRRHRNQIVAVVLDLTVPGGMGGIETLQELRKLDPHLPALVASGFAEAPALTDPATYGFNASIRKPYLRAELEAKLRQVTKSHSES